MAAPFELDDELRARVDRLADRRQQSSDAVMREAIDDYVTREEERDAFLDAALQSEKDFEKTGLHLTFEEVEEWLKTWGTDHERPMPDCHR